MLVFPLSLCRNMEDFVTWTDTSKIRRHVLEYNDEVRESCGTKDVFYIRVW